MNALKVEITEIDTKTPSPKSTVTTFVLLCFLFSSVFWFLIARLPTEGKGESPLMFYIVAAMWCPAVAAVLTRFWYQRNLKGFGFRLGKARWLFVGIFGPVVLGLGMFGSAWISGVAPLDQTGVARIFSISFIPFFLVQVGFNCIAAFGEELGWRGFLVPELARGMNFTGLSLLSGVIWTVWHFPLIIFGPYHGAGSLWYSLAVFTPFIVGTGVVAAWLRLASGSVWVGVLSHGFWNLFMQGFYPRLTQKTPAGEMMLGEFGWLGPILFVVLAVVFWRLRNRLPQVTP